ncbi:MAG: kinase-like domain-containing protein [Benjaminiella poitrasii]|nr:MAG: kinase-like domain-containing protein [Benjaminiella poitrasii]
MRYPRADVRQELEMPTDASTSQDSQVHRELSQDPPHQPAAEERDRPTNLQLFQQRQEESRYFSDEDRRFLDQLKQQRQKYLRNQQLRNERLRHEQEQLQQQQQQQQQRQQSRHKQPQLQQPSRYKQPQLQQPSRYKQQKQRSQPQIQFKTQRQPPKQRPQPQTQIEQPQPPKQPEYYRESSAEMEQRLRREFNVPEDLQLPRATETTTFHESTKEEREAVVVQQELQQKQRAEECRLMQERFKKCQAASKKFREKHNIASPKSPEVHKEKQVVKHQGSKRKHREDNEDTDGECNIPGYKKFKKIGEGTYGEVFKAREIESNDPVAIKKIKASIDDGIHTTTLREIAILKLLEHNNVVRLKELVHEDSKLFMVFEYADMDLRRYMDTMGRQGITAGHIQSFMSQLLNGLHYCHGHRILHRDLKPQNLLIDRQGRLKIADLGLSRTFNIPMRTYTHHVQTLWYRAPEILLGSAQYSTAVDMWSAGCIFAELMTLSPLFPGGSQIDALFRIFEQLGTPSEKMWPGVSALPDYNERFPVFESRELKPTLERFKHYEPLPSSAFDLLESMLQYDPAKRISAIKAEDHPFFLEDLTVVKSD